MVQEARIRDTVVETSGEEWVVGDWRVVIPLSPLIPEARVDVVTIFLVKRLGAKSLAMVVVEFFQSHPVFCSCAVFLDGLDPICQLRVEKSDRAVRLGVTTGLTNKVSGGESAELYCRL